MDKVDLFQFELCPFCHKVKAGLELKGIPYDTIEVNPMNKEQLPPLPEGAPKKVPVIQVNGETIFDSTTILNYIEENTPDRIRLSPEDPAAREKSEKIETWVDEELTFAIPTVIYGTVGEATRAAQVVAKTSNFGFFQNIMARAGGFDHHEPRLQEDLEEARQDRRPRVAARRGRQVRRTGWVTRTSSPARRPSSATSQPTAHSAASATFPPSTS